MSRQVTVIIPAIDEGKNLRALLPQLNEVKRQLIGDNIELDIMVVLPRVADSISLEAIRTNQCRYVNRVPSDSFGDAIRTGIVNIPPSSDFTVCLDADGSHNPRSIEKLIHYSDAADVVVASRYTKGGSTSHPFLLEVMSRLLNMTFRLVIGIPCSDISTNFKLYRSSDLKQLELRSSNFDIIEEILIRLKHQVRPDLKILEVPDHFGERIDGRSKRRFLIFSISYVVTLVKMKLMMTLSSSNQKK